MLKPLLVNRSLKPRALKGKDLNTLPVHWMANKKAWVTTAIFTEWFNKCFVPEVENYMKDMGLEFKILLILDNAPGHPNLEHPNIKEIGGEGFDDFGEHDIEELLVDEALNDDDILESMVDTTKDFETVDSELEDVTPLDEKLLQEGLQLSAKVRKCDLSKLAYELGEVVPPESRIVDLKRLILNSQSYEEEFAKQLLETLIEEREQTERAERERMEQTAQTEQAERIERERIEDRKRIEDRERIERKEQMVMEFELEKLRIQTTRGNNDTSRSTSNDAHYEIRKLMPKYESKDNDLSFYLILFERQAKRLGLDEDQWAFSLLGLLPYEMTQLIARETEEQSGDYRFVKRLLLKRYKLSPEQFRQKFEKHERSQKGSWRDFAFELRGYFNEWIEGMNVENFDALKDLSVTNQLKKKVPNVLRNHLIDDWTKLNNPDELADKTGRVRKCSHRDGTSALECETPHTTVVSAEICEIPQPKRS
ncbi:hypothetical protein LAZ67_10001285 [Cordylochernes scorpioides]|uniref:DDE-1 domain-containing protein n=1 Tax=Cordylochernes scorpioides TaxID=51811 RepID=A0ABY6KVS2_9ARAC|nr:hypothetical protein LAZ67_10001285 [Cordylochernes scorpioides]